MKRAIILIWIAAVLHIISSASCCNYISDSGKFIVTMVTDTSGIGDKGFNEIAWKGMQRAEKELGVELKKIESSDPANYVKNLAIGARYSDLTVANGFLVYDAMNEVCRLYPDSKFVFVDGVIDMPNVASYTFRSEEVGFLAGILAAGQSKTHRVGILKGMSIPSVNSFAAGFRAGAACADLTWGTTTDVKSLTAGDFNDPQKGFNIVQQFINDDRDIVYQLAGATALGAITAIRDSSREVYLIGVDLDQDDEIPGKVLTSTVKRIDTVVYDAIKAVQEGHFTGGHFSVGISENALSLTDMRHTKHLIRAEIHETIARAEQMITSGMLVLPNNEEALKDFVPRALNQ